MTRNVDIEWWAVAALSTGVTQVGRRTLAAMGVTALLTGIAAPAMAQTPPAQAANAGFTNVLFNSDFSTATLSAELSCAGTPQTKKWKQGLFWEGQNDLRNVVPCSQIGIGYDSVFQHNVLDLEWTASGNTDPYRATSISTFPLDTVSPHFAFRHGYIEAVARISTTATGVWPAIWTWGDSAVLYSNTPPFKRDVPASEFDIMEAWGGPQVQIGSHLHEWYSNVINATLFAYSQSPYDLTKPHTFGLLWASNGVLWQGGYICAYVDNVQRGCANTTAASEAQDAFLILGMGVGCNQNYSDVSCLNGLKRADMLVSRVTVFGQ
jgi:hypothetical protein